MILINLKVLGLMENDLAAFITNCFLIDNQLYNWIWTRNVRISPCFALIRRTEENVDLHFSKLLIYQCLFLDLGSVCNFTPHKAMFYAFKSSHFHLFYL